MNMAMLNVNDLEYLKVLRKNMNDCIKIIDEMIDKMTKGEYFNNEESEILEARLLLKMQQMVNEAK